MIKIKMDKLPNDIILYLVDYINDNDILNLLLINKRFYNLNYIWKIYALRNHPLLPINSKHDFFNLNPTIVNKEEIQTIIKYNKWENDWYSKKIYNYNNKLDNHFQPFIISIVKNMLHVSKYRKLYTFIPKEEIDWKIAVNKKISELLEVSEQDKKDMERLYNNFLILKMNNF